GSGWASYSSLKELVPSSKYSTVTQRLLTLPLLAKAGSVAKYMNCPVLPAGGAVERASEPPAVTTVVAPPSGSFKNRPFSTLFVPRVILTLSLAKAEGTNGILSARAQRTAQQNNL